MLAPSKRSARSAPGLGSAMPKGYKKAKSPS